MSPPNQLIKDYLFFDLDGTLVDSAGAISLAWDQWANLYSISKPKLERALGGTSIDTIRELVPAEEVYNSWLKLTEFELETACMVREVEGARKMLDTIPPAKWGLITSSRREIALKRLESAGIAPPKILVTADDYTSGKPDPAPYATGLALTKQDPSNCLAFEDSISGVQAASAAKIDVVGILTYKSIEELRTRIYISGWKDITIEVTNSNRIALTIDRS